MFRHALVLLALVVFAVGASAESRASRLARAHEKLKSDDAAGAIELLRELQVEQPGDERVLYALGCAQYKLAEAQKDVAAAAGGGNGAQGLYKEAQGSFESLASAKDPEIARNAAFNRANCLAQAAKASVGDPKNASAAIGALRSASTAYEDFLRQYPGDKGAQQNLDHVRFLLKKLTRENKDEQKKDDKQDKKDDQKNPPAALSVRNAKTEIPGATAVVGEDSTVRLVKPGAQGGTP